MKGAAEGELVAALDAAAARDDRLLALSVSLGEALSTQRVADAIVSFFTTALGTAYATVMLLEDDARSVRHLRLQPVPDEVARLMAKIPAGAASATGDALGSRQPVFHPTLEDYLRDYPHLRDATEALGVRALAHLPLVIGGRVLGVLSLSWGPEQAFTSEDRRFLTTVAGLCSLAVHRAELFEQKSEVASILQRAILPGQLPRDGDVRISARYLPAEAGLDVGGDWYDAFYGSDDRLWFSVGDVGGHGVEAALVMGQLRNAIRTSAYADLGPAAALDVADRLLARLHGADLDAVVATAVVAALDLATGELSWSNAGHLPPVLIRSGEPPELMEEQHGPLLGVDTPGRAQGSAGLAPGDLILMYTDGLVENREESLDVGTARLLAAIRDTPQPGGPSTVADQALAASLAGYERRDDLCLLVVQRAPHALR